VAYEYMNGLGADDDLPVALTVRGSGAGPDADALAAALALQQCQKELAKTQQEKALLSARLTATQLPTTTTHVVAPGTGIPGVLTEQGAQAAQRRALEQARLQAAQLQAARQAAGQQQGLPTVPTSGWITAIQRLFGKKPVAPIKPRQYIQGA
jgi:hypothetical protein